MTQSGSSVAALFERCARVLEGATAPAEHDGDVLGLLDALEFQPTARAESGVRDDALDFAHLLRAAARFRRVFQLEAPEAPGLTFFGAEADPASVGAVDTDFSAAGVSGVGFTLREAFASCVGEGVEYLSQFESAEDEVRSGDAALIGSLPAGLRAFVDALAPYRLDPRRDIGWVAARRLGDHAVTFVPADICLRRGRASRAVVPPFTLGTGCAAGRAFDAAAQHALLELIERDAASLWWRGGRRGHAIAPESDAGQYAAGLLASIRRGVRSRNSWLLDITTDVGVPCVAAISARADGFGFACGLSARPTMRAAVHSAILEMCQIELAYAVVAAKRRERGDAALNARDLSHLRRSTEIDTRSCLLLHPLPPRQPVANWDESDPLVFQSIVERLSAMGIEACAIDLTRPTFAVPVVRVVASGLQLEPCDMISARLALAQGETGGGAPHTRGVALL